MFSTTANNDSPETDPKQPKQSGVTADYCTKLQQWMWQCYWGNGQWQSWGPWRPGSTFPWGPWSPFGWGPGSTFPWVPPYTLTSPGTSIQTPQSHASSPSSGQQVLDTRNWSIYPYQLTFPVSSAPHPGGPQSDEISPRTPTTDPLWPGQQQNGNPAPQAGQEYTIPSPLQRFLAETVDFFILFCVKATIVLCIMRLSGMKDFAKFIIQFIVEEIDENTSMEDLQKMMAVALVHRVLVCVYETVCIWSAGGATPGKFLLGLRVVTCDTSTLVRPNRVLVVPATNVSLSASTVRALNKNFSIAFLFPIFITLLFFQHNRTVYDIVAGTIVVQRRRDR